MLFRIFILICGLFFISFGVALSVKADLGVSPISCIPYVFSLKFPFTLGELTIALNSFFILLQVVLLRKDFQLIQFIQLPVVFLFGFFIDLSMLLISGLAVSGYVMQILLCLTGCVIMGWGVFLEVKSKVTFLAGEGLAMAITKTFHQEFGKSKVSVDSSMVIVGVVSSFLFFHQLLGIREGTILSALLVGFIARFFNKIIPVPDHLLTS